MRRGWSAKSMLLGLALSIGCGAANPPPEQSTAEGEVVAVYGNLDATPQLALEDAPTLSGATDAELSRLEPTPTGGTP
ncbi:MAG: hypothetical protein CO108_17775 [Deltaproteobacteria bacterium CG_4_9_14_3_um_filter_63_12]|nr:MAG: hypothetical protein CO108_17775 [Deltaproteobacteria bacterium CG_4_9_14_3_um_filter_63_12]